MTPAEAIARIEHWGGQLGLADLREAAKVLRERIERAERDDRLLWGVVHNAKGKRGRPRWAAVREAIGCGSGWAADLCRRFDADPDATQEGPRGWQPDTGGKP